MSVALGTQHTMRMAILSTVIVRAALPFSNGTIFEKVYWT